MSNTTVRPMANDRAERIFVASGLPDSLRPAVSAEANMLLNVGAAGRFSDAVDQACRWAKQGVFTGKLAQGLAAAAAIEAVA